MENSDPLNKYIARVDETNGKIEPSTQNELLSDVTARIKRVIEIQKELELRNALYAEYDAILLSLAADNFGHQVIDDMVVILKDNFAQKNTSFTSAAVKRYDIEVISTKLFEKRAARKK